MPDNGGSSGSTDVEENPTSEQPDDGEDEMLEPQECEDIAEILFSNYNIDGADLSA